MSQNLIEVLRRNKLDVPERVMREPNKNDDNRWVKHTISGKSYLFTQPLTFTPYASVQACSARCHFCSENLRDITSNQYASLIRPNDQYFEYLKKTLIHLQGLPMSYSLSGLEMTDNVDWFLTLLDVLSEHRELSPIQSSVLYSNASGIAENKDVLVNNIADFEFDWLEVSRHHFNEQVNQKIMRFRPELSITLNSTFINVITKLLPKVPVKLVCLIQSGGVESKEDVYNYLTWAKKIGVNHVIFREFSKLDKTYKVNSTSKYISSSRKPMTELLDILLLDSKFKDSIDWTQSTKGYYFNNLVGLINDMKVTFECSDYSLMNLKHDSDRVYKLVFHANGNLNAGWSPDKHILYESTDGLAT